MLKMTRHPTHDHPSHPSRVVLVRLRALGGLTALCLSLLAPTTVVAASLLDDIPAGTGYAAWDLCTRVIASGDDYWRVRLQYTGPKVQPLPWVWDVDYYPGAKVTVRSVVPLIMHRRSAIYRKGLGCTLVPPGATEWGVRLQPIQAPVSPPVNASPWPVGEATATTPLGPVAQQVMARHAALMFSEPSLALNERINTTALLVAHQGALVHEQYRSGYKRDQAQLGWSMTKTLTALIAGVMHTDGRLALDQPVGLPQWQTADKAHITWRHLLNMAPGLAWSEGYEGLSDATQMLFSEPDQGAWAADRPLTSQPGTVFTYSTGFANLAMYAMRQNMGGSAQAFLNYCQQRLFNPLGIRNGMIELDASGTPVGGARGVLRPVDWLRLGQLVANHGTWQGRPLIDAAYMDFMTAPSPASADYGGMIWRHPSDMIPADLRARLPHDLVWFAGHMGQFMIVIPSRDLVVLRMGVAHDKDLARIQTLALTADLLDAL